jgi:hypothetical protein
MDRERVILVNNDDTYIALSDARVVEFETYEDYEYLQIWESTCELYKLARELQAAVGMLVVDKVPVVRCIGPFDDNGDLTDIPEWEVCDT